MSTSVDAEIFHEWLLTVHLRERTFCSAHKNELQLIYLREFIIVSIGFIHLKKKTFIVYRLTLICALR